MSIALLVIGDGRKEKLIQTVQSAEANLIGDIKYRLMINDSAGEDPEYDKFLLEKYGQSFCVISQPRQGLAGAIQTAWKQLLANQEQYDIKYIFHLEEDFIFNEKINLNELIFNLNKDENLVQMVLKREPVNPPEREAGGWIQQAIDKYIQRDGYAEQSHLFILNPNLYSIELIQHGWPSHGGETEFTNYIHSQHKSAKFGILGDIESPPKVSHIGSHRSENWML